ncbi:response regulator transcription factor [Paenibacillus hexagrammi]|uniref:Response regulator n=1 Tax=Paenibacillus hexagrammi TaxID=2908839 RepID=A0ABY3SF11_9BACL|nr:response regulator [Paenibacillus sp. YPD9-1]UJF31824.1 response regulator [Paenibacillus sp. YPD9-1]
MYRVMIVDDEPIIRSAVKSCINWNDKRLKFVGEYANGLAALQALIDSPADILFTDIKMPVMDGLELLRKAKGICPDIKVILISSYQDFEYVREGMVLGAIDYIQKSTMEPDQLDGVISRSIESLEKERLIQTSLERLEQTKRDEDRKKMEYALKKLLSKGNAGVVEVDKQLISAEFQHGYIMVLAIISGIRELLEKNGYLYVDMLMDELQEQFYERQVQGIAIMTKYNSEMLFVMPPYIGTFDMIQELKLELEKKSSLRLTLGFLQADEPRQWIDNYGYLSNLHELCFFHGGGGIHEWQSDRFTLMSPHTGKQEHDLAGKDLRILQWYQKWMKIGASSEQVKRAACDLLSNTLNVRMEPALLVDYSQQIMKSETLNDVLSLLYSGMNEHDAQPQTNTSDNTTASIIERAIAYIHEHFTEDITLQMVAEHVHVSRNYFSLLYKKQTNLNFIDYLIQLRIKRAKEQLSLTTAKVYEVAANSGFKDVKYFSKLFKKITGMSPLEYREQLHLVEEE